MERGYGTSGVCPLPNHCHGKNPNPNQFKISCKNGVWLFHCFSCHKGGDIVEFVKAMTGCDNESVSLWFWGHFGGRLQSIRSNSAKGHGNMQQGIADRPVKFNCGTPTELRPLAFRLQLDTSVPYLTERGLTSETIHRYGLGLCSRGVLQGYIAIPVYMHTQSAEENPVAYFGRWAGDDFDNAARPRYVWPKGFAKSHVVYGLREALSGPKNQPLIVVEGPFKVYHLFQAGFPRTVAVFGSSLSDEQARILTETGCPIILLFDGDEAGQAGMRAAAEKVTGSTFTRTVVLSDGKAPDDLSADELRRLFSFVDAKRPTKTEYS